MPEVKKVRCAGAHSFWFAVWSLPSRRKHPSGRRPGFANCVRHILLEEPNQHQLGWSVCFCLVCGFEKADSLNKLHIVLFYIIKILFNLSCLCVRSVVHFVCVCVVSFNEVPSQKAPGGGGGDRNWPCQVDFLKCFLWLAAAQINSVRNQQGIADWGHECLPV